MYNESNTQRRKGRRWQRELHTRREERTAMRVCRGWNAGVDASAAEVLRYCISMERRKPIPDGEWLQEAAKALQDFDILRKYQHAGGKQRPDLLRKLNERAFHSEKVDRRAEAVCFAIMEKRSKSQLHGNMKLMLKAYLTEMRRISAVMKT